MRKILVTALLFSLTVGPAVAAGQSAGAAGTTPAAGSVPTGRDDAGPDPTDEPDWTSSTARSQTLARDDASRSRVSNAMMKRFARERVKRGDRDLSPTHINHVREVQYRLRWVGLYRGHINGVFNFKTQKAVKAFQQRKGLKRSGKMGYNTWPTLIKKSIRGRGDIPRYCKQDGWRICYDRSRHQVVLWHNGRVHNSWLVRGGGAGTKTRTGKFRVYYRSRHHVSSLYNTPMPYAQFFDGGQAFHASYYMVNPFSGHSHGCVNMYIKDARQLWALTAHKRLLVRIYGAWS